MTDNDCEGKFWYESITDNHGLTHKLKICEDYDSDTGNLDSVSFHTYFKRDFTARLCGVVFDGGENGSVITLADVEAMTVFRGDKLTRWLRKRRNLPLDTWRERRLGTQLLLRFINYATHKGFSWIIGEVRQQGLIDNPNLLRWYRKYGFQVDMVGLGNETSGVALVAHIQRKLS